jgi:hypothetical protein
MPSQILDAAGMLNIADGAIFVALGVQGSDSTAGQLKNTELIAMLDARYPTGASTVTVRFGTGISGTSLVNPTSPHTLDAWDAAIAWV